MSDITTGPDTTPDTPSDIRVGIVARLPLGLLEDVDVAAAKQGISRNAFIVKSLQRVIDGEPK